jgi:hypothetical protein
MTVAFTTWVESTNLLRVLQVPADSPAHAVARVRSAFPAAARILVDVPPSPPAAS